MRWAKTAPKGEIRRYDTGHFEIYQGDWFARIIADQIDFFARTCRSRPSERPPTTTPQRTRP